ncbi:unnamed protein product, partial [Amoebophrya sp. A25]
GRLLGGRYEEQDQQQLMSGSQEVVGGAQFVQLLDLEQHVVQQRLPLPPPDHGPRAPPPTPYDHEPRLQDTIRSRVAGGSSSLREVLSRWPSPVSSSQPASVQGSHPDPAHADVLYPFHLQQQEHASESVRHESDSDRFGTSNTGGNENTPAPVVLPRFVPDMQHPATPTFYPCSGRTYLKNIPVVDGLAPGGMAAAPKLATLTLKAALGIATPSHPQRQAKRGPRRRGQYQKGLHQQEHRGLHQQEQSCDRTARARHDQQGGEFRESEVATLLSGPGYVDTRTSGYADATGYRYAEHEPYITPTSTSPPPPPPRHAPRTPEQDVLDLVLSSGTLPAAGTSNDLHRRVGSGMLFVNEISENQQEWMDP